MPRFVLLYHDCPSHYVRASHWDFMLEAGKVLRTWTLAQLPRDWQAARELTASTNSDCPPVAADNSVSAEQLGDHRLDYLEKEGPLSGDRGRVIRIDRGTYDRISESRGCWRLTLAGGAWCGQITLQQNAPDSVQWTLTVRQPAD